MGTFFVYILKSALCLALFYLFYRLLLSRETFHRFNRFALLGLLVLSCLLPLVQVSVEHPAEVHQTMLSLEQLLMLAEMTAEVDSAVPADVGLENFWMDTAFWVQAGLLLYFLGILFFLARNGYSLCRLGVLLRSSRREALGNYIATDRRAVLLVHDKEIAPFSWMRYIVLSRTDLQENGREILTHELAHIHHRHSLDLLVADLCCFVQWFNPAAWLLKQELQNIHEYEADDTVLLSGIDAKQYQLLLIKKAVGTRLYSMSNSLNHSKLKKRITMMMKEKSNPWARMKYLYVLPLAAVAVSAFARPEVSSVAEEISQVSADKVNELAAVVETKVQENVSQGTVLKKKDRTENISVVSVQGEKKDDVKVVGHKGNGTPDKDPVLEVVEQMPEYPGGMAALMQFLAKNIRYPAEAHKAGTQGRVIAQFVVDRDGSIDSLKVIRSVSPEIDAEALRVLGLMPNWKPGMQRGDSVRVRFTIPVMFRLTDDDQKNETTGVRVKSDKLGDKPVWPSGKKNNVLVVINGSVVNEEVLHALRAEYIQGITVLKDSTGIDKYGDAAKGKDGVLEVTLKKEGAQDLSQEANQNMTLWSGQVLDEKRNPLVGALVQIEGTKKGTVTDKEGKYELYVPQEGTISLVISYPGMKSCKLNVSSMTKMPNAKHVAHVILEK